MGILRFLSDERIKIIVVDFGNGFMKRSNLKVSEFGILSKENNLRLL